MFVLDLKRVCNRVVPCRLPRPTFLSHVSYFKTLKIESFNGYIKIAWAFHVNIGSTKSVFICSRVVLYRLLKHKFLGQVSSFKTDSVI